MASSKKTYSKRLVGDINEIIALAEERAVIALRETDAWEAVEMLARAVALRAPGADAASLRAAAEKEAEGQAKLVEVQTDSYYATIPPLAVTHPQIVAIIESLLSML